ncbi:hypothetical protein FQA39_LY13857 [Lamprigera yunnana]|nr:hypothetical protein FQA39_LY13857 [Lamprigera yunnana]
MILKLKICTLCIIYFVVFHVIVLADDVNEQRIKRNTNTKANNEEFEKFFLKASKSVPRIGRRGSSNDFLTGQKYAFFRYPFGRPPKRSLELWSDMENSNEYNPESANMEEYLRNLQRDGSPVYESQGADVKNDKPSSKELYEYRMQEEP